MYRFVRYCLPVLVLLTISACKRDTSANASTMHVPGVTASIGAIPTADPTVMPYEIKGAHGILMLLRPDITIVIHEGNDNPIFVENVVSIQAIDPHSSYAYITGGDGIDIETGEVITFDWSSTGGQDGGDFYSSFTVPSDTPEGFHRVRYIWKMAIPFSGNNAPSDVEPYPFIVTIRIVRR